MPSALHRGLIELFRRDLALVPELVFRSLGVELPAGIRFEERDGRLVAHSFVDDPREIQVDLLILAEHGEVRFVTTLEAQLGMDPEKRFRFLEYIATARRDHRCAGMQTVFSPDPDVLTQIRRLFAEEPHFCPVLLGPSCVPKIVDVEAARARPTLATLSAIVHARSAEGPAIIETLVASWRDRDPLTWHADARILWSCTPEEVMNTLSIPIQLDRFESDLWDDDDDDPREPSNWEKGTGLYQRALRAGLEQGREQGREQGLEQGLEQGQLAGLRQALLVMLAGRGLDLTERQRDAIATCLSSERLEGWIAAVAQGRTPTLG